MNIPCGIKSQVTNRTCGSAPPDNFYTDYTTLTSFPREEITLPVVFHVVWSKSDENISDEVLQAQLQVLNDDFNRNNINITNVPPAFQKYVGTVGITFCLADESPMGTATTGILRVRTSIDSIGGQYQLESTKSHLKHSELGGSDAWDTDRYLNVWISNRKDGNLGKAIFPTEVVPDGEDGIEIFYKAIGPNDFDDNRFNEGRTLTHEVGHYLNLSHLWGRDNASCFNEGDMVDDTPTQSEIYFGCPIEPQSSCNSRDMISNFMEFSDDSCLNFFTKGQANRMLDGLFRYRYTLISSGICTDITPIPDNPLSIAIIRQTPFGLQVNLGFLPKIEYSLRLYNISGQLFWSEDQNDLSIHRIQSNGWASGVYFLQMNFRGQKVTRKIFIANIN
jgi:hypothetical protein